MSYTVSNMYFYIQLKIPWFFVNWGDSIYFVLFFFGNGTSVLMVFWGSFNSALPQADKSEYCWPRSKGWWCWWCCWCWCWWWCCCCCWWWWWWLCWLWRWWTWKSWVGWGFKRGSKGKEQRKNAQQDHQTCWVPVRFPQGMRHLLNSPK